MWSSRFVTTVCVRGETVRDTHFAFSAARRRPPCVEQGARRRLPSLEQGASSPATTSSAPPPPPRTTTTTTTASPRLLSPRRPRLAGSYPHHGLAPPPPLTTADLSRRQPRGSSLDRLCRRHHTAAEQIEMRDAGHDAGAGILNWTEIQCVDLTQSLREGVRSSRRCSVAEGTFTTLSFICEMFLFLYVGMDALDIEIWKIVSGTHIQA
ncbi:uncharacterized protein LOC125545865 isoform X3 [Triticum urartu]|nr:uncharacterized protein LOC125545863 [Triticum urartu]XP_048565876.1 uncharacterized protein LOC125545865 isoform X3 [Triticum urartu]